MGDQKADVNIVIAGDESKLREAIKEAKEQLGELVEKAQDIGKDLVIGGLGLGGVGFTIEKIVDATVENERASTQLSAALKATGGSAGLAKKELLELAEQVEKTSTFEKSNAEVAETMLLRYTNIGEEVFPRALKASADLAAGMGIDLAAAAEKVGSTLNNPLQALNHLRAEGIAFTKQQQDQIKMMAAVGDTVGAQTAILDALEHAYGGAAAAARDTFGGALQDVKHAVSDLFDGSDGNLQDAKAALHDLADELRSPEVKEGFATLTQAVITLVSWLAKAGAAMTNLTSALPKEVARLQGYHGNVDDMSQELADLIKRRDAMLALYQKAGTQPQFSDKYVIDSLNQQIAELQRRIADLTKHDSPAAPEEKKPAEHHVEGVFGQEALAPFRAAVAQAQAANTILQAELQKQTTELEGQLQKNLISYQDYYAKRTAIEQRGIDSEIKVKRAEVAEAREEARQAQMGALTEGDPEKGAERAQAALAKVAQLTAEVTALEIKRGTVAEANTDKQAEAEKRLSRELDGIRAELLEIQGKSADAAILKLHDQFDDQIKQLQADGNAAGVQLAQELFNAKAAQANLDQIEKRFSDMIANLRLQQELIQADEKAGIISRQQAANQILDAQKQMQQQARAMIPDMEKLAAATGNPDSIQHVKELELEFKKLQENTNVLGKAIEDGLTSGLEEALDGLIKRTSTFAEAWKKLWTSVNNAVDKAVEKKVSDWLVGSGESGLNSFLGGGHPGSTGGNGTSGSAVDQVANEFAKLFSGDSGKSIVDKTGDSIAELFRDGKDALSSVFSEIGDFLSSLFGGGGGSSAAFSSASAAAVDEVASVFHSGGIAGSPGAPMRRIPALTFAGAPRFHSGGEVPAILQAGEEVLTANDPRHVRNGGKRGGDTHVHVHMNVQAQDATSFRHSQGQIMADAQRHAARAFQRNG